MTAKLRSALPLLVLGLAFVVSRVLAYAAGVRMGLAPLDWYWQYLPLDWLQHDLLRGLYYMHDQPPLYNFYLGAVLQACGAHAALGF